MWLARAPWRGDLPRCDGTQTILPVGQIKALLAELGELPPE